MGAFIFISVLANSLILFKRPVKTDTYAGSFLYHLKDNLVACGYVVGLDYKNPHLNPYKEFQRWKHHPAIRSTFEGGEILSYGARSLVEGGLQKIPDLVFPGGCLIGDTAGFLNVAKIKGTHNAMKSGMLAAESAYKALGNESDEPIVLNEYPENLKKSWLWEDLYSVRNIKPSMNKGLYPGLILSGFDTYIMRGKAPWTLQYDGKEDWEHTLPKDSCEKIEYPKPDGKISFPLLENLARSGTNHEEDQPNHLKIRDMEKAKENFKKFGGVEQNYCPANVYEWIEGELQINKANCLHCKTCDIMGLTDWTTPEGGGGPLYSGT